ncbi:hypothetical protein RHSP_79010 [Rhizobium freirei PRF 81]|uniref:Uncharacterized protein n=1 Tax=Rhizobium freirei PRF 81 TaxID=363754 RepID=N6UQV5_9HYPH|nr:hypothetical protein RHSP_79010 [Rhizobium freirei PRF 81]
MATLQFYSGSPAARTWPPALVFRFGIGREIRSAPDQDREQYCTLFSVLDEFRRVGLRQVDRLALDVLGKFGQHGKNGFRTVFGHHTIGREHGLAVFERLHIPFLVTDIEVFRHLVGNLGGRVGVDEMQRLDESVRKLLRFLLVILDPRLLHIERRGRIGATQSGSCSGHRAHVDEDLGLARLQETRDRRLRRHAGLDGILLHGGDEGLARTDRNGGEFAELQAGLDSQVLRQEVGRGTEAGDAEVLALEVGGGLDLRMLGRHQLDFAGRLAELHDGFDELALALKVDAVIVEADDALDGACKHFIFGIDAGRLVEKLDVETLILEIAEPFGKLGGQIDLLLVSAHHDRNLIGRMRRSGCKGSSSHDEG